MSHRLAPDCWGWHAALGLFAVCLGLKCVFLPLFSHYHSYAYLALQPIPQAGWAALLLLYGTAALACVFTRRAWLRGTVSVVGVALWLYLGGEMLIGSIVYNAWLADGFFELGAGLGCFVILFLEPSHE